MDERETREIEATVDTGAAYTTLPARLLRELGVEPMGQRRFLLADGRRVDMDYGQAWGRDRWRACRHGRGLWRGRRAAAVGCVHAGGSCPGSRSGRTAAGSYASHHVLAPTSWPTTATSAAPRVAPPWCSTTLPGKRTDQEPGLSGAALGQHERRSHMRGQGDAAIIGGCPPSSRPSSERPPPTRLHAPAPAPTRRGRASELRRGGDASAPRAPWP